MNQALLHPVAPDQHLVVYNIDLYDSSIMLVCKTRLIIYDLFSSKVVFQNLGDYWYATFIPHSRYIAFLCRSNLKTIWFHDIFSNKQMAHLKVSYPVYSLKASRGCITIAGLKLISIVHFPTLGAIYHGVAGDSLNIVYDISHEGVTLAHNTKNKGEIQIKNFTTILTNSIFQTKRQSSSNSDSIKRGSRRSSSIIPKINKTVSIFAHEESISLLKLSQDGLRLVSASRKGTILRVFNCRTGDTLQQLRMSYEISKVKDISFFQDGNAIVCINEDGWVKMFNVQMSETEQMCESARKGYKIYQLQNPKSFFRFLGALNKNLQNQRSFCDFKIKKNEKQGQQKQITNSVVSESLDEQSLNQVLTGIEACKERKSSLRQSAQNLRKSLTPNRGSGMFFHLKKTNSLQKDLKKNKIISSVFHKAVFTKNSSLRVVKDEEFYQLNYDPFHGGEMSSGIIFPLYRIFQ